METMTPEERLKHKLFMLDYYATEYLNYYKGGGEKYTEIISDLGDVLCMELARMKAIMNGEDANDFSRATQNFKLKLVNKITTN